MENAENPEESRQLINMEKEESKRNEEYLYRIIPLRYFLLMLDYRKIYVPKVSKWDDPYELFLLKQKILNKSGQPMSTHNMMLGIYGQCWSTQRDNDAMWRIYSPDRMSVRIKTQKYKIEELCNEWQKSGVANFACRDVNYYKQKDLETWISSLQFISEKNIIDSLFMKRDSFSHEKEYRVIACYSNEIESNRPTNCPDTLELPFEPNDFIQEVYLDPRLSCQEVALLKNAILIRMGEKCRVSQSTLYKLKRQTIII